MTWYIRIGTGADRLALVERRRGGCLGGQHGDSRRRHQQPVPNRRLVSMGAPSERASNRPQRPSTDRQPRRPSAGNTRSARCYARTGMPELRVTSAYRPTGDQPSAIAQLAESLRAATAGRRSSARPGPARRRRWPG